MSEGDLPDNVVGPDAFARRKELQRKALQNEVQAAMRALSREVNSQFLADEALSEKESAIERSNIRARSWAILRENGAAFKKEIDNALQNTKAGETILALRSKGQFLSTAGCTGYFQNSRQGTEREIRREAFMEWLQREYSGRVVFHDTLFDDDAESASSMYLIRKW